MKHPREGGGVQVVHSRIVVDPSASAGWRSLARIGATLLPAFVAIGALSFNLSSRARMAIFLIDLALYWAALSGGAWLALHARTAARWARRRAPQLALAAASLALTAIAAELALGVFQPWRRLPQLRPFGYSSPTLHHAYPPNARMQFPWFGERVTVETNEDGLRSPYSRSDFLARPIRIVALGDSFTFGTGVGGEAAWPALLEAELRVRLPGIDLAALNAGIVSYSPLLERNFFHRVVREYRPTLALAMLDATDIADDRAYAERAATRDGPLLTFDRRDRVSGLSTRAGPALLTLTENLGLGLTLPLRPLGRALSESGDSSLENHVVVRAGGVIQRNHYFIFRLPLETTRPYFDRTWENVVELARETREAGADFALIVAPRYIHWDPTECPENLEGRMYVGSPEWHFEYIRYFDEAAATADFPVLRLLDAFERTDERPLVFRADSHWNAAGHRVAARAIAEFIVERGLVTDRHGPRENPSSAR